MDYQKIILVGNATQDAKNQKSKKGDVSYTTFSLGVASRKDETTFYPIVAFGALGEKVATHIAKGQQLLVEGRINVNEKNRFNVIASQIRLGFTPKPKKPSKKTK